MRFIHGHHQSCGPDYLPEDRGYATPCWVWQRSLTRLGYPMVKRGGRNIPAYQWEWEQANGAVPSGLELDHLCRVPACVNPAHLEAVTHAENCRRGASAKLTPKTAAAIRSAQTRGSGRSRARANLPTVNELAAEFGVNPATIYRVRNGQAWKSEDEPLG